MDNTNQIIDKDIYSPPKAELQDIAENTQTTFYVVSERKFTILFLATLGLYELYWFYKNWSLAKAWAAEYSTAWPVPRAIFNIFFTHSLFALVDKKLKEIGSQFQWNASGLASGFVIFSVISQVLDRLSVKSIGSPFTDILSLVVLFLMCPILLKAQRAINVASGDDQATSNSKLTGGNYTWIILGIVFWGLYLWVIYDDFILLNT